MWRRFQGAEKLRLETENQFYAGDLSCGGDTGPKGGFYALARFFMKTGFYRAFEDRYRGSRELIRARQEVYLDFLRPLEEAVENPQAIDLGCGRGEFLEILLASGFRACGVDMDEGMLEDCLRLGLHAEKGEAVKFLSQVPSNSQAVVSAFHVVEHIAFDELMALVAETHRVLVPGGIMILETPNPENPRVGHYGFYMDPTHQKPIPPPLLSFVAEHQGFHRVKILRLQESLILEDNKPISLLDVLTGVSPDYSIVAQKNGSSELTASLDSAFSREYGVQIQQLTGRYDDSLKQSLGEAAQKGLVLKAQQEAVEKSVGGLKEELAQQRKAQQEAVKTSIGGLKEELAQQRKAQQEAVKTSIGGLKEELAQQRKAQQEAVEKSVGGLKEELVQQRKAQQEAVEKSVGEVKREIVAEIHSLIANLGEQVEKNRLAVSARIDSVKDRMEGRVVEVGEYAAKIQEAVVSPSSYLIPTPFSWYSYLYKMLNIKKPNWINEKNRPKTEPQKYGFWRRLERSIRKRRERLIGRIGFDREWYLQEYPEVGFSGIDPLDHYLRFGIDEGRWKSKRHKEKAIASGTLREKRPGFFQRLEISIRKRRKRWTSYWTFDPAWYLEAYPEVRVAGIDPLHHYVSFGKKEGRQNRAPETDLIKVMSKAFKRACGFKAKGTARCFLAKTEGPWWILNVEVQRPAGYYGRWRLRLRSGERETYLEKPGTESGGAVRFRHLLKLPSGHSNIRVDWEEEGWGLQEILNKTNRLVKVSQVEQSKFLASPINGQTDMSIIPKYGLFRSAEKKLRKWRKNLLLTKKAADNSTKIQPVKSLSIQLAPPLVDLSPNAKKIYYRLLHQIGEKA